MRRIEKKRDRGGVVRLRVTTAGGRELNATAERPRPGLFPRSAAVHVKGCGPLSPLEAEDYAALILEAAREAGA